MLHVTNANTLWTLITFLFTCYSIDDEEREQHYQEIKHDLEVAEENMNDTVEGEVCQTLE